MPRKITKILPYRSGGFAVLVPYHQAQRGYLSKHPVDYGVRDGATTRVKSIEYSAEDRVKLSIHPDGFVQFSGERQGRIVSGRDLDTGEPKGLGLMSQPLDNPVMTGPTFAVTVWGLNDFVELGPGDRSDAMVFTEESFYYRRSTPETWSGTYLIEGFVFPLRYWQAVRKRAGGYILSLAHPEFELPGSLIEYQVMPLPGQSAFLGFIASRFSEGRHHAPSGFVVNGPSEYRRADALLAMYPSPWSTDPEESLDYRQDSLEDADLPQP